MRAGAYLMVALVVLLVSSCATAAPTSLLKCLAGERAGLQSLFTPGMYLEESLPLSSFQVHTVERGAHGAPWGSVVDVSFSLPQLQRSFVQRFTLTPSVVSASGEFLFFVDGGEDETTAETVPAALTSYFAACESGWATLTLPVSPTAFPAPIGVINIVDAGFSLRVEPDQTGPNEFEMMLRQTPGEWGAHHRDLAFVPPGSSDPVQRRHAAARAAQPHRTPRTAGVAGPQQWAGCIDDDKLYAMPVGLAVDSAFVARFGGGSRAFLMMMVQSVVADASLIFRRQLGLVVALGRVSVFEGPAQAGPAWGRCDAFKGIQQQASAFRRWRQEQTGAATFHLMTGCSYEEEGPVALSWTGGLCTPASFSVCQGDEDAMWMSFAHNLGHNLGAHHSSIDGSARKGGLMDPAAGALLDGAVQFSTDADRAEMCRHLRRAAQRSDGNACLAELPSDEAATWETALQGLATVPYASKPFVLPDSGADMFYFSATPRMSGGRALTFAFRRADVCDAVAATCALPIPVEVLRVDTEYTFAVAEAVGGTCGPYRDVAWARN